MCLCSVSGSGGGAVSHLGPGGKMRCVLRDFQDRMGLLAAFAFVSYYGSLLLVDAWAPWQPLTGVNAARNFAAIIIPACGYGVFPGRGGACAGGRDAKKASMDPLTGLKNRRAMLNDIQEMLETLSDPLWLVCLDLDNFKSINDQYGHDIGDPGICGALGRCWKK